MKQNLKKTEAKILLLVVSLTGSNFGAMFQDIHGNLELCKADEFRPNSLDFPRLLIRLYVKLMERLRRRFKGKSNTYLDLTFKLKEENESEK